MSTSPGRRPSPPSWDELEANDCRRSLEDLNEDGTWGYIIYRTYTKLPPSSSSPSTTEQQPAAAPPSPSAQKRKRSTSPPADAESNQSAEATQSEGATTADSSAPPEGEGEQDPSADPPQWRQILDKIKHSIEDHLSTLPPPYQDEMKSRLRLTPKHLPGASMPAVRESLRHHFAAQDSSVLSQHKLGIMVDEDVAASVLAGREPGVPKMRGATFGFGDDWEAGVVVKVVDGGFEEDETRNVVAVAGRRPRGGKGVRVYHGWMKVTPRSLWSLWRDVVAEGMRSLYKGPDFVYDG